RRAAAPTDRGPGRASLPSPSGDGTPRSEANAAYGRGSTASANVRESLHEAVDELGLQQHLVCARVSGRATERRSLVAGERDQADVRMVSAQARSGGDAVEQRHVEIDDDGVRIEALRELDRLEAVGRLADDRE